MFGMGRESLPWSPDALYFLIAREREGLIRRQSSPTAWRGCKRTPQLGQEVRIKTHFAV
jgi:hypothetical protein